MQMEQEVQVQTQTLQRKVSGFDKAILTYRKLVKEASVAVLSKRKEEFIAYVQRVVFQNGNDQVVNLPSLHIQQKVVDRMRDM